MSIAYVRLESFRQMKNARTLIFSLAVPVVMLFAFGGAYGGTGEIDAVTHLPWIVVTTIQMAAYGGMIGALSQSFNIVTERSLGWNRQLRITPLTGTGYLVSKVVTALLVALFTIVVVILVSIVFFHPDLGAMNWIAAAGAIWLGVLPFTLIAIVIGQFAKPEYAQPMFTAVFLFFSLLGGLWVPLQILPSWVANVAQIVPSYWLNRVGQMGAHLSGDALTPGLVLLGWTVVLGVFIIWRYRRDAARS
jgi:ABC-2 type transport system permease protein